MRIDYNNGKYDVVQEATEIQQLREVFGGAVETTLTIQRTQYPKVPGQDCYNFDRPSDMNTKELIEFLESAISMIKRSAFVPRGVIS